MVEGKEYVAVREVAQRDANGNTVFVEKQKRIKNWFYTNNSKNWFLEVRYGNRALGLAEGKTAIAKAVSKRNANKQSKNQLKRSWKEIAQHCLCYFFE